MSKEDYINFLKTWFPINKAKGLIAQISFENELESGFLKKHNQKFYPGCWVVSPKSHDSNKFRYVVSVHETLIDHDPQEAEIDSLLGRNKDNFYKVAKFLSNASLGVIHAVPFSATGTIDFSRINSDDFTSVVWVLFFYEDGKLVKKDAAKFFSNWRSGMRPRKPQLKQKWDDDTVITSKLMNVSEEKLEAFVLKEMFYTGYLKSIIKISTDDPYDVDAFILSSKTDDVFPLELKEKSVVYKEYKRGGKINEHYFGIDSGRISCLERICSPSDSNAFYVVREVDDSKDRNLIGWKVMTLSGIAMGSSWNAISGGTGMFGSGTSTVKLPYGEFEDLSESTFDDESLEKISSRSKTTKKIAEQYDALRKKNESK